MAAPLPVGEAIGRSLRHVAARATFAVRASLAWYLLVCLLMVLLGRTPPGPEAPQTEMTGGEVLAFLVVTAVQFMAICAVATIWHRFTLLGAPIGGFLARPPPQTWHYLWTTLLIGLLGGLAAFACLLVFEMIVGLPKSGGPVAVTVVIWLVAFVVLLLTARLSMALPAAALGRRMSFTTAAEMASGNTWRIAGAMFAIALLTAIPAVAVDAAAGRAGGAGGAILAIGAGNLFTFAGTILGTSLLSHIYVWCDGRNSDGEELNI